MDFPTVTVTGTGLIGVIEWQGYAQYNREGAPGWPGFEAVLGNPSYVSSPADTGGGQYTLSIGAFPSSFWNDAGVAPGAVYAELDPSVYPATETGTQDNYNFLEPLSENMAGVTCPNEICQNYEASCFSSAGLQNPYTVTETYFTVNGYTILHNQLQSDWSPDSAVYHFLDNNPPGYMIGYAGFYDGCIDNSFAGGEITYGVQPNYSIINIDDMPPDTIYTFNVENNGGVFGMQLFDDQALSHYPTETFNPSGLECSFNVYSGTIDQFTLNSDGTLSTTATLLSTQSFSYTSTDAYNNNFSVQRASPPPVPVGGPFGEFGVPSGGGGVAPATQNNPGPPKAEAIFFIRQGTLNWHRGLTYGQKAWYTGLNKGQGAGFSWVGSFPWFLPPGVRKPTV